MTEFTKRAIDDFIAEIEDFLEERSGLDRRATEPASVLQMYSDRRVNGERRQEEVQNFTDAAIANISSKTGNTR